MGWTLNINKINITLEEMPIIGFWKFDVLIILTEVNFYGWFTTKFGHEGIDVLSLFGG